MCCLCFIWDVALVFTCVELFCLLLAVQVSIQPNKNRAVNGKKKNKAISIFLKVFCFDICSHILKFSAHLHPTPFSIHSFRFKVLPHMIHLPYFMYKSLAFSIGIRIVSSKP